MHIRIFGIKISMYIPSEKRSKLDIYKTLNGIFIEYTDTTQHLRIWTPKTHQVLIASELVINKLKRCVTLLVKNPMSALPKPIQQPARESRLREKPRKRLRIEKKAEYKEFVEVETPNDYLMRTESLQNQLAQRSSTDLGGKIGENPSDGLVRLTHIEFAKTVTETNSQVREPKTYDEAINNLVHANRCREVIDEEFWNLNFNQT